MRGHLFFRPDVGCRQPVGPPASIAPVSYVNDPPLKSHLQVQVSSGAFHRGEWTADGFHLDGLQLGEIQLDAVFVMLEHLLKLPGSVDWSHQESPSVPEYEPDLDLS